MDSAASFVYNCFLALILLAASACGTPKSAGQQTASDGQKPNKPATTVSQPSAQGTERAQKQPKAKETALADPLRKLTRYSHPDAETELVYENRSQSVNIPIDMDAPFIMELSGTGFEKGRFDREKQVLEMRQVMRDFRKAQDLFVNGEYQGALESISRSLATIETAEGMALKGTIYFLLRDVERAKQYWDRARRLDPEISVPSEKDLEQMLRRQ